MSELTRRFWNSVDLVKRFHMSRRERTRRLRCATDKPLNPIDDRDDEHAAEISAAASQEVMPDDIRFHCKEAKTLRRY